MAAAPGGPGAGILAAILALTAKMGSTGITLAQTGVGLVGSIAKLQTSLINMTTGFEVGFQPMIKAFNDSVEAVHKQEQQTAAMGVQRESLRAALGKLGLNVLDLPGNMDEVMGAAIGLFQFGIGANMETSLELANTLRLQGAAGLALVKGFNSMGRSLFMTQESIDVLQEEILNSTESQSITTEALIKGLSETAAALKPAAMIEGLSESLLGLGAVAGKDLGEAGMGSFNAVIEELTKYSSIKGTGLMGIEMGWINELVKVSATNPSKGYEMLKEKLEAAGAQIEKFGGGPGTDLRVSMKMLEDAFGPLGPAVKGFLNAVENAEKGVGAGAFGGLEGKEIGATTLTQAEQFMNDIREQANTLGELQEKNAIDLHDKFVEKIISPVATAFGDLIVDPLSKDGNLIKFAEDYSEMLGTMVNSMRTFIDHIPGVNTSMGSLLTGFKTFNSLLVDELIPFLSKSLAGLLKLYEKESGVDTSDLRVGLHGAAMIGPHERSDPILRGSEMSDSLIALIGLIDNMTSKMASPEDLARLIEHLGTIAVELENWRDGGGAPDTPDEHKEIERIITLFKSPT